MKIAVLSGKGGTGKTTLSVNLFSRLSGATLIDTDVEEPNSHIFLDGVLEERTDVFKKYPVVDQEKCTLCNACGDFCQFNSIFAAKKKVIVFPDLCHDCGGCSLVCKPGAISFTEKSIGTVTKEKVQSKEFLYGTLEIGEVSGVKIIEELKEITKDHQHVIIDSPPGTSCSTVSSVEDVDYAIIVSEPTPFGVSDMKMVVQMLMDMGIQFGVVINKAGIGNDEIYTYLNEENIEIIEEIRFDKEFASYYAKGHIIGEYSEYYRDKIDSILKKVLVKV
jgi:MinD superfamily P-loop ATPase